jgi:hypothetical protein
MAQDEVFTKEDLEFLESENFSKSDLKYIKSCRNSF